MSLSDLADRQICFPLPDAVSVCPQPFRLEDAHAEALTELLQVFACGEESAALAFASLEASTIEDFARSGLAQIAGEELVHEGLLRGLRAALPAPKRDRELRISILRFFHGLSHTDIGLHLAAIASLDSAVCTILAALTEPGRAIAEDFSVASIFHRIHRDEARHVRFARRIAAEIGRGEDIGGVAEKTRFGLVDVLAHRGGAFESLDIDADRLFVRLRRVPDGLFR